MAKEYLPAGRQWTQRNDGTGTIKCAYNVDLYTNRGSARVSKPLLRVFDTNTAIDKFDDGIISTNNGEKIDRVAQSFVKYSGDYYALANVPYYTDAIASGAEYFDVDNWQSDESAIAPDGTGAGVVWDDKLIVEDNSSGFGRLDAYDGSDWTAWFGTGATPHSESIGNILFMQPSQDGNLYILDENNYVHKLEPDDTRQMADDGDAGTLDFSSEPYEFTCVGDNSTRLFIGFENTSTSRGGIIEWDRSPTSRTANRIHQLGAIPRVICVWNDMVITILSNGKIKYFNGSNFVDYDGFRLPKIEGKYDDDFIHPNGWAIIDDMPHFLIKGSKSISGSSSFDKDTQTDLDFPSAVYCLDPQVGLYPRFALTNNLDAQTEFSSPAVNNVGALYALEENESKFFASYEVYTTNSTANAVTLIAYHDEAVSNAGKGFILFESVGRMQNTKNIELIHRLLPTNGQIRAFYQEYDTDEQIIDGAWASTTQFNTTDAIDVDDKWLAWVKVGNGAGQFLRVEASNTDNPTNVILFKDANTYASASDFGVLHFVKFRHFGTIDGNTLDYHTLTLPSEARSRKVKLLLELSQGAGEVTEIDYGIIDT